MHLSIVTINFNNAQGLRKTLASVASQTCTEFEHVIIDGGSSDGSKEIIEKYAANAKYLVKWVSEKDKGIYNGMNKGILMATGEYIEILNSGDCLASSDVVERMLKALVEQKNKVGDVPIFYGNMIKDYGGKQIKRDTCGGDMYTPESFLYFYNGTLNHDCAYIRRDLFNKYGLYDEQMQICSDWEWYVKAIVLGGEKAYYTNIDVTIFDMGGVSEDGGKNRDLIKKERREYLESVMPASVLRDYDMFAMPIFQYQRLKRHHLWFFVNFAERVLFKLEKWGILK